MDGGSDCVGMGGGDVVRTEGFSFFYHLERFGGFVRPELTSATLFSNQASNARDTV